jgi:guanine deaminase
VDDLADTDIAHLERAIELSRRHMEAGDGGPFGAVVAHGREVLAEGWNCVTSTNDPTAHAEVVAIRRACTDLGRFALTGATLYASCEPCPMCLAAAYWARVGRIVFANTRDEAAAIGFSDAAIYEEIPKAPAARSIPTLHAPRDSGRAVFADWIAKADRTPY